MELINMIKDMHFNNIGYLDINIPTVLFNSLKQECDLALNKNSEMKSGLSGGGVPIHKYVEDKNNLKSLEEYTFKLVDIYKDRFEIDLSQTKILTNNLPLKMGNPWINYQKKNQFIPNHAHDGIFSYTIWIDIPYDSEDELKGGSHASTFEFTYFNTQGNIRFSRINLNKSDNGRMLFFPSTMTHQVYPFYTSEDYRVSISGNLLLDATKYLI